MKKILFRADSSSTIGTGHIMRDLVLAKQYPNTGIIFATQDLEGNLNSKIIESGYKVESLFSNNVYELIELVNKLQIDMVVIDHYGIDYRFEKELKDRTGIKVMVLDDTYEKHYCDILLNHNIYAKESFYKGLIPLECELRCGEKYTLLRDEFMQVKKNNIQVGSKKNIFIAMGGIDYANLNIEILRLFEKWTDISINIITTTANKNLIFLEEYVKDKKNIKLHINTTIIAKLMSEASFAIVTPSVTMNEIYFLKVPFIGIKTADNQRTMAQYLQEKNFYVLDIFNKNILLEYIQRLIENSENYYDKLIIKER